ncbi:SAM-dependent methyltransferase [Arenibaculum pallidiluteum]|uniref:SAM-dependent methyltransferase n=1 Tax=Arenibaculum pallidiluteum TaxID=2812559 RepID=UPI001A96D84D|nr:class I SAM-dependent methyltransferase [Arenibaculum pallidiluteum]
MTAEGAGALRSNVAHWRALQDADYFENHQCYGGLKAFGRDATDTLARFLSLRPDMQVAVVGCGYGRDTLQIAPQVAHVYGIDVSARILTKAHRFLEEHGVRNFTPVLAELWRDGIPDGIDLVFSIVVMQHLTRDLVRDYFAGFARKLAPGGSMVIQFLESRGYGQQDAELATYEPSVNWTCWDIMDLAEAVGLQAEIRTDRVAETALWHWGHFRRPA